MSILIFIIVLLVLIITHELGHFAVAKWAKIRVDEFGIGFPPKLWGKKYGETEYTVNALPFGGFVKIFGEDPENADAMNNPRSFVKKSRWVQAAVLAAGVFCNALFAWILISIGYMVGLPTSLADVPRGAEVHDARLVVTTTLPNSPAADAGVKPGDQINAVAAGADALSGKITPEDFSKFVSSHGENDIVLFIKRADETIQISITPEEGIVAGKKAIGVGSDYIGTAKLPVHRALWEGARTTSNVAIAIVESFGVLIRDAFIGKADVSTLTGPVGIVGLVGDAAASGFVYLLSFTAIISINLAVINLVPFPALDGGRLLFLIIEAIKGSPISTRAANAANTVGFAILILLMLLVTYNDIARMF